MLKLDRDETGISKIFDSHAEEHIQHNAAIATLRGRGEKPDRIYGLRKTKRFTRLLVRKGTDSKAVEDTIRSCPFRKGRAELIFPFLILEAKSEKAGCSGTDVRRQTACSIVTLLQIQQELSDAATRAEVTLEPLVWFLSNKGEHWKVAAGVVDPSQQHQPYVSIRLSSLSES